MKNIFFSIIVPAYNEESYIERTIDHLINLNYSADSYEVIIIENGSRDKTKEIIKKIIPSNFIYDSIDIAGVSRAKNRGFSLISQLSEWLIILDADTILKDEFLNELNKYINQLDEGRYTAGTPSVSPDSKSKKAKYWFEFYNFAHWLTRTTYSIQIVRSDMIKEIQFDEELTFGEDTKFIEALKKKGKFFFYRTDTVLTSTRRFDEIGYVNLLFIWMYMASIPYKFKKLIKYKAIR